MDNHIHLQQAAGITKVGYNAYYDQKLAPYKGLMDFSGSRADKKYWIQNRQDTENHILKLRAHEKSLASVSGSGTFCVCLEQTQ